MNRARLGHVAAIVAALPILAGAKTVPVAAPGKTYDLTALCTAEAMQALAGVGK